MFDQLAAQGMQVMTLDGRYLGTVMDASTTGITLQSSGASEDRSILIPGDLIAFIDEQVHLSLSGQEAVEAPQRISAEKKRSRLIGGAWGVLHPASVVIFIAIAALTALGTLVASKS